MDFKKDVLKNEKLIIFVKQAVLYGIIGVIAASLDSGTFFLLDKYTKINVYIINFLTINLGILTSFLLNSNFNFKVKDKVFSRAVKFFSVGYFGLLLSQGILYLGINVIGIENIYVKLFSVVIIAMIQFILNKLITFRGENDG